MPNLSQLQVDPLSEQILNARAHALAQLETVSDLDGSEQVLLFQLGVDRFSLPAVATRSVLPLGRVTALPATPSWILGLVNVRGRLLAAVDLRPLLKIASAPPRPGAFLVIVQISGVELALLADMVIGVERASVRLSPQPATAPGQAAAWIRGVDDALTIRIDPELLLSTSRLIVNDPMEHA